MNGWDTIKQVRDDMREATALAKDGATTTACACMGHARRTLETYCNEAKGPKHGFERCNNKRH